MPNPASEFFGMDFGTKQAVVEQQPAPTPEPQKEKGVFQSAAEFFGLDFTSKTRPQVVPKAAPVVKTNLDQGWDAINASYAKGKPQRDDAQLLILKTELAKEKDPTNIAALKREISRVEPTSMKSGGEDDGIDSERKRWDDLPKYKIKDILATGFGKLDKRNEWVDKMEVEFNAATKGMTKAQKDKFFSNSWHYAKKHHPTAAASYMYFHNIESDKDVPVGAKSYLEHHNPDVSFSNALHNARGWVYTDNGDRMFIAQDGDINTMVHEAEHMRQQKDFKENKLNANHVNLTSQPLLGAKTPAHKLRLLSQELKDDPGFKEVWRADNAHDSNGEWLANLVAFMKTGIPEGKSWSDTKMFKSLVSKVGEKEAITMLIDAITFTQKEPRKK